MASAKHVRAGKRSRVKGKTWERAVCRMLRSIWSSVYRGHQDSRGGAKAGEGCDVEGTPYYVECRHEREYNWRKHLREALAMRSKRGDARPVVLVAKDDKRPPGWRVGQPTTPPIAIMLLEEWVALAHELARWRSVLAKHCPEHTEANCAPWDYLDLILSKRGGNNE